MQSDAKSAFCKRGHQNDRPGLNFGGLWGSLWITLGDKWHLRDVFLRGQNFGPIFSFAMYQPTSNVPGHLSGENTNFDDFDNAENGPEKFGQSQQVAA